MPDIIYKYGDDPLKQLLFVAMPFGKRMDGNSSHEIDFDVIYEKAIKPAATEAGVDVIRADEERQGGIIHIPMFERLLLAEIVIADLSIQNPNVYYELGVRHASRPRSTILMYAKEARLPFDVSLVRAVPYSLEKGVLTDKHAKELKLTLTERLEQAKKDLESHDSPLFQVISNFPGIDLPHEVTESFRDRVKYIDGIRDQLKDARRLENKEDAKLIVNGIRDSLDEFNEAHAELLIDLILSYRDIEAWSEMVSLIDELPKTGVFMNLITIKEQYAFALNRRNKSGDRHKAIDVIREVIESNGASPENCGIIGRVYKDLYEDELNINKAQAYLDKSIYWYNRGFEADPRDYYPGVNAATLMYLKGDDKSLEKLKTLIPTVSFAVARRGAISSNDYWDVATVLEVAILSGDWTFAKQAGIKLIGFESPTWMYETTVKNLEILKKARSQRNLENKELSEIVSMLST